MSLRCLFFGHRRKYVGVEDIVWNTDMGFLEKRCPHGYATLYNCDICGKSNQIARWVCPCGSMGERYIRISEGVFTIHFGRLVPDEKRWANWKRLESK
jgi:hypothetical protein